MLSSLAAAFSVKFFLWQANDGQVISHSIILADGSKKTLGVILPGEYHFATEAAERMEIVAGSCQYQIDGVEETFSTPAGKHFDVAGNSGFTITVVEPCHYVCSYLSSRDETAQKAEPQDS